MQRSRRKRQAALHLLKTQALPHRNRAMASKVLIHSATPCKLIWEDLLDCSKEDLGRMTSVQYQLHESMSIYEYVFLTR